MRRFSSCVMFVVVIKVQELAYNVVMKDERIQKLKERAEYLIEAIGYMEDRQGFAPKDLMEEYDACMRELRSKRKGTCV